MGVYSHDIGIHAYDGYARAWEAYGPEHMIVLVYVVGFIWDIVSHTIGVQRVSHTLHMPMVFTIINVNIYH